MGERKMLNKYYPPDFDPAKIPRQRQPKNKQIKVRMMLPMNIQCNTCGNYIYKGTKFNSRKEDVIGETYLRIQIFKLYFNCTKCSVEIIIKTDPKNSDYLIESGAMRNCNSWYEEDKELKNETHAPLEEDVKMSFGSILLRGLTSSENDGDLETCCRAASVLSHVLKDNIQCTERILRIELEAPMPSLGGPEPLMHRMVKYLALASSMNRKDAKSSASGIFYVEPTILKLLIIWLSDYPGAVQCFLDSPPHLTYLLELISNPTSTVCIRGLAALLLGECVIYNKCCDSGKDAFSIVDSLSQKVGLRSYLLKFDDIQKSFLFSSAKPALSHQPLTRSTAASMAEIEDIDENEATSQKNEDHPKSKVAVVPAEMEQKSGESDGDYIKRLKSFVEKQCSEIQDLLSRNATLAEDLSKTGGGGASKFEHKGSGGAERVQAETLRRSLQEASQRLEMLKAEKTNVESEASMYRNLAGKMESDLKSLSDAYNRLEQSNFHLEKEVKALKSGGAIAVPDVEAIKAEAQKESEAELNDLLVCPGQEQSKVERLIARLLELGEEDVEKLLEGVGDDMGMPEYEEEDD